MKSEKRESGFEEVGVEFDLIDGGDDLEFKGVGGCESGGERKGGRRDSGLTFATARTFSKSVTLKLETPMDLTRPSALSSA